jgi:acyl carrier protein
MQEIKNAVRGFLAPRFGSYLLRDDENLFATGYVTSLFAMQLVNFTEQTFGVQVESDDLDLANFSSIDALCGFVQRKQRGVA